MALHIIIDGYNLIRNSADLKDLDRQDIQLGREALVDMLAAYKKIKPHKITVVFDGAGMLDHSRHRDQIKGILIKFSRAGESADSVIIRMAENEKERALIVSSDQEIIRAALACRSATITSPGFAERMLLANFNGGQSEENERAYGRRSISTKKKGPRRRLPRRQRRNRGKMGKL
jgi:predicted RNA-binding protein with PIN domain